MTDAAAARVAELAALRRGRDLIDREYDRPLDVTKVAQAADMSRAHFTRRYRAVYGETPHQHLLTRRVERAKALLRDGRYSVTEVCVTVGFSSLGSFCSRFRELAGCTPSQYRDQVDDVPGIPSCVVHAIRPGTRSSTIREAAAAPAS